MKDRPYRDIRAGKPIEVLDISQCGYTPNLHGLRGNTTLRELRAINLGACTSLDGLEDATRITELNLGWCATMQSLAALRGHDCLRSFEIQNAMQLRSLEGFEGATSLERLTVRGARLITSLAPIAGLASLKQLVLENAILLTDIAALATLPALETLDLRGCPLVTDVATLEAVPSLRRVALRGTAISPKTLPASLAPRVTWERRPDFSEAPAAPIAAPKTRHDPLPKGTGSVVRKKISSLRKLLSARDFEQIDQGRELLVSLADDALWEQYLQGVQWTRNEKSGFGEFVPNAFFDAPKSARPFRDHALFGLLACAPTTCATANTLREAITDVEIQGLSMWKPVPVDLASLVGLSRLARLDLSYCREPRHPEALAKCTSLRTLAIRDSAAALYEQIPPEVESLTLVTAPGPSFTTLAGRTSLRELTLRCAAAVDRVSLAGCTALRHLSVQLHRGLDALDLTRCDALEHLDITSGSNGVLHTDCGEALRSLRVLHLSNLDLAAVAHLVARAPKLERLELTAIDALASLGALSLPASLKTLRITRARALKDLRDLASLSALETLGLEACQAIEDIAPIASLSRLKTLSLRGSRAPGDVLALDSLTKLKRLDLRDAGRQPNELNERLRAIAVWR